MNKNKETNFHAMTPEALARWREKLDAEKPQREKEGRLFKEAYQRLGISRNELARRTNMSASTIAKFEQGKFVRSRKIVKRALENAARIFCHEMLINAVRGLNYQADVKPLN